jgi:hypothetical protein
MNNTPLIMESAGMGNTVLAGIGKGISGGKESEGISRGAGQGIQEEGEGKENKQEY